MLLLFCVEGERAGDPTVTDIRSLLYSDGNISFKLRHGFECTPLKIRKKTRSREPLVASTAAVPLYSGPIKINADKYSHLQELKEMIPSDYHLFYDSLPH